MAKYTPKKIESLCSDTDIIRNKLKINSSETNAKFFIEIQKEFGGFDKYIWSFVGNKSNMTKRKTHKEAVATTPESDALSADLKKHGFKFVGSTIMYAHMQACGLVMDHEADCFCYKQLN